MVSFRSGEQGQPAIALSEGSYRDMPKKGQIALLILCRITEPLAYQSVAPYLYYMVKSFGISDPPTISLWGSIVMTSFSLGQSIMSMWWGRFSDTYGRKPTLLLGLLGTAISLIVFGTAQSVWMATFGRVLAGMLNGNVGVMRTMIAEFIGDRKEFQSRAFVLLPMTMNVGTVVAPVLGGFLANPSSQIGGIFDSPFWRTYPYLLPNLMPMLPIALGIIMTFLFIEETLDSPRALMPISSDVGLKAGRVLKLWLGINRNQSDEIEIHGMELEELEELLSDPESTDLDDHEGTEGRKENNRHSTIANISADTTLHNTDEENELGPSDCNAKPRPKTIREVLAEKPVRITLIAYCLLTFHIPAFYQLFTLFLSTPASPHPQFNFIHFNGGLGMSSREIGVAVGILGFVAVLVQLLIYPRLASRIGNANTHKLAIAMLPFTYFLLPYISYAPTDWRARFVIFPISAMYMVSRTFAIPPMAVLITNAAPTREVLGTVHGLTHSLTSLSRTIGPMVLGYIYAFGMKIGVIGSVWWIMTVIAIIECFIIRGLRDW